MIRCSVCGICLGSRRPQCARHSNAALPPRVEIPADPAPLIPGYQVGGVLGVGGFATVFSAVREANGARVAIKVAKADKPESHASMTLEFDVMRSLGPEWVPEIIESGTLSNGAPFAAMEWISAPMLADVLEDAGGPLPVDQFATVALALASAVAGIHRSSWVHRDLKPENVFVEAATARVRLLDFGIACKADEPKVPGAPEQVLGTAEYMSPEQVEASVPVGTAADVYALGVILYELATGRPPFLGTDADVQQAHRSSRPPRLSSLATVPADLEAIILRCLEKEPGDRFANAGELAQALEPVLARLRESAFASKAEVAPGASAAKPEADREKRTAGLLFFSSQQEIRNIEGTITKLGGMLAHYSAGNAVAVFTHEIGDNPAKRAFASAETLLAGGITERVLVELQPIMFTRRKDGTRRFMSALFTKADLFPPATLATGVYLSQAVTEVLRDIPSEPVPAWPGVLRSMYGATGMGLTGVTTAQSNSGNQKVVGREEELTQLIDSAKATLASRTPGMAAILAEAGHGKSVLGVALIRALQKQVPQLDVIEIKVAEPLGGNTQRFLQDLLRLLFSLKVDLDADTARAQLRKSLEAMPHEVFTAAALALDLLPTSAPEVQALTAAPGALRMAGARAIAEGLRQHAEKRPVALVVDDAHWADDAALDGLEFASLPEHAVPLWICAIARPSLDEARPKWGTRAASYTKVELGTLSGDRANALCRQLLEPARDIPLGVIERLVARTQGVPLLMVELVRALKQRGLIRSDSRGGTYLATDELEHIPDLPLVQWLASRELDGLAKPLAAHARLCAALGNVFDPKDIKGVLGELDKLGQADGYSLDPKVATDRLKECGLVIRHRTGQLTFRHALVREAVYAALAPDHRAAIHRAALGFYQVSEALTGAEKLHRVAYHAVRAGMKEEAFQSLVEMAVHSQSGHRYLEAEGAYSEALTQLATEDVRRMRPLQGRALMRYRLQRYDDALKDFEEARSVAAAQKDVHAEIEILLDAATALDWAEDLRRSKELVDQAKALAEGNTDPLIKARLTMGVARSCWRFNEDEQASKLFDDAAQQAEALGDVCYETYVISLLANGYVLATLGRLDDSERAFDRVIPFCAERGDKLHLATAIGNRIVLWIGRNDRARLTEDMSQLLALGREMGNPRLEQQAHYYHALYLHWLGDLEEAEVHARKADEVELRRFGDAARSESSILVARVVAARGKLAEARQVLDEVRRRQSIAESSGRRESQLLPAEEVLLTMVDLSTSEADEAAWDALQARAEKCLIPQDLLEFYETRAVVARRRQLIESARQSYERALVLARKVPNVALARLQKEASELTASA